MYKRQPLPCPPIRVKWNGLADLEQVGEQAAVYQDWIRRMCGVFGYPLLDLHQKLIRVAAREGRPLSDYFLDGLHMNEEMCIRDRINHAPCGRQDSRIDHQAA